MRTPLRLGLALLVLSAAAATRAATPPLLSPATVIPDPRRDPAWSGLFARLAPADDRLSRFEEKRYFPFRRKPVVLTGEIRIDPGRGLSLHYLTPESRVLIVDAQGVLMRDALGRDLPAPSDARAQAAIAALVDVMRFNLDDLQRNFEVHGLRSGAGWTLAFVPRDRALAEDLTLLVVSGAGSEVAEIDLRKSPKQHIDIFIHGTRRNAAFSAGDLARFFR